MEKNNKPSNKDFHAVEFMRKVRTELSQEFLNDKQKYLGYLKKSMEDFKLRQKKVFS